MLWVLLREGTGACVLQCNADGGLGAQQNSQWITFAVVFLTLVYDSIP